MQLRFLDTIGDTTGSDDMNVDGSVTPQVFMLECPPKYHVYLESVSIFIQDEGAFTANGYGGVAGLTNGLKVLFRQGETVIADVTDQVPIKSNSDWMSYSFEIHNFNFSGGQSVLAMSYNLAANGRPYKLSPGQNFAVIVRDDLTGLTKHRIRTSSVFVPIEQ